jgi:diamine N-acetyltransferase
MSSSLSIRFADPQDIGLIGYLAQQSWPQTYQNILTPPQIDYMMNLFYSPTSLNKQMVELGHQFLIAEETEEPVGFAAFSAAAEPGLFKLHKIYVLPNQQGKGLGRLLLDFIAKYTLDQGADRLQLNVNRHNDARKFYEKLGFRVIRQEDIDIGENYFMNDYVMELDLADLAGGS